MLKTTPNEVWTGRIDHNERRSSFRYHQKVENINIKQIQSSTNTIALIGFECDEGVRRNKGRIGAAKAPNAIRKQLSNLPWTLAEDKKVIDVGNVECTGGGLEEAQKELGDTLATVLSKAIPTVILGGGHETFYGHYLGVRNHIGKDASLGIINIDAHFDLRSYDEQSSSGTMFRQILEQDENCQYFVLGIQQFGNTVELFEKADELGVLYVYEEELNESYDEEISEVRDFIERHDAVIVTLCMDVLNAAFAPGVSAPSPFGLSPQKVRSLIRSIASEPKVISFDICEVNPLVDENDRTTKLAAYFVNEAIVTFLNKEKLQIN